MIQRKLALLVGITMFTLLLMLRWEHIIHLVSLMRNERPSAEPEPQTDLPSAESTLPLWQRAPMETISPIPGSRHLMVSAFKDHRLGGAILVISIICRQELQPLYCVLCANGDANDSGNTDAKANGALGQCTTSQAKVDIHSDHFGFPFHTSDVFCTTTTSQQASYVSITSDRNTIDNLTFLTIQNQEVKESFRYKYTICISNLFGGYNNALQFAQTMEVYKLIGVQRVVIYNTSCGSDVEKVLTYYMREGMLEVVPWPLHKFLTPSTGWKYDLHHGDIHYYGQLTTLNECIYRYMYQSKYLLLNDIDEIIMPYKHGKLEKIMDTLQQQHPNAGVFRIENHIFPKTQFEDSGRFRLPQWRRVPGVNILEHIYREPDRKSVFNPTKLLIDPRRVEQTSAHTTLKQFGPVVTVPFDVCRIIHVRAPLQGHLSKDQLLVDKKLWEFEKRLIPSIDHALNQSGLL
ncbi:hypothetical protein AALO_G00165540 [Alosa alosa]|uniref:Glycosyltransferase family 92 protein n=1 Tax=Alosa alosa TaxID=278164 RepID=A0AAV6GG72_9TELE|nr:uncharacterized protein LOC125304735 [Alosa alosa]XP_048115189.1 uncharacterized protein LOC125304735 [Alosa alosa]KAG5272436.1 hypothetical protein AALO_G00165540 [Alosa alosa]